VAVEYNESNFIEPDEVMVNECDDWRPKRKQKMSLPTDFSQIKLNSPRISKQKANVRIDDESDKNPINPVKKMGCKTIFRCHTLVVLNRIIFS